MTGSHESCFVKKVLEVCTGESDRGESNLSEIDIISERLALRVDLKDGFTLVSIRLVDHDAAVESSGSQESRVEDIDSVGSCHDDNVRIVLESVHLNEDLVKCLLTLVLSAAETCASLTAYRIDLVDEDYGRSFSLGIGKERSYT